MLARESVLKSIAFPVPIVSGLAENWEFQSSPAPMWLRLKNAPLFHRQKPPRHEIVKRPSAREHWVVLFIYAPTGRLDASQLFMLNRLKDLSLPLFVVATTPDPQVMPFEVLDASDALIWKGQPGYDFSAYALALRQLASDSPRSNVVVMNDSVCGPFSDFRPLLHSPPWDLTGFTASGLVENHLQSYALIFRSWDEAGFSALRGVLNPDRCFNAFDAVVVNQEMRLATLAASRGSVGALWYGDGRKIDDPTLRLPRELMDAGLPFLKKSLLGKNRMFNQESTCLAILEREGHPLPAW